MLLAECVWLFNLIVLTILWGDMNRIVSKYWFVIPFLLWSFLEVSSNHLAYDLCMTGCDWKIMSHLILIDLWKSSAQVDLIEFAQGSFKSQSKNGITLLSVGNLDLGSLQITSGENIWLSVWIYPVLAMLKNWLMDVAHWTRVKRFVSGRHRRGIVNFSGRPMECPPQHQVHSVPILMLTFSKHSRHFAKSMGSHTTRCLRSSWAFTWTLKASCLIKRLFHRSLRRLQPQAALQPGEPTPRCWNDWRGLKRITENSLALLKSWSTGSMHLRVRLFARIWRKELSILKRQSNTGKVNPRSNTQLYLFESQVNIEECRWFYFSWPIWVVHSWVNIAFPKCLQSLGIVGFALLSELYQQLRVGVTFKMLLHLKIALIKEIHFFYAQESNVFCSTPADGCMFLWISQ